MSQLGGAHRAAALLAVLLLLTTPSAQPTAPQPKVGACLSRRRLAGWLDILFEAGCAGVLELTLLLRKPSLQMHPKRVIVQWKEGRVRAADVGALGITFSHRVGGTRAPTSVYTIQDGESVPDKVAQLNAMPCECFGVWRRLLLCAWPGALPAYTGASWGTYDPSLER